MICFATPIILLLFLDYYNLEGYNLLYNVETHTFENWSNKFFNQNFVFEWTWKGRMFYLIFLWLLFIELITDWKNVTENKPKNRYIILASIICALIPTFYVVAINFFGLDLSILRFGRDFFNIRSGPPSNPSDFLHLQWPLSCEYVVFTIFFVGATVLAYKWKSLRFFSISFALLGGMGVAYLLDTIYPFGLFKPLQEFALITAASTAALFDLLGYTTQLRFPTPYPIPDTGLLAYLRVNSVSVNIGWACAGVHSLLLYILIILLFFKKSSISSFRRLLYFMVGLFGTFFVNVLRVYSIVIIMINQGQEAGLAFHNTYGELYFFAWISIYILVIVCIQSFRLVERTMHALHRIRSYSGILFSKLSSYLKAKVKL